MKFGYVILYVEQVVDSLTFYTKAFRFPRRMITPEKDYGELQSGETVIAFASITLGDMNFKKGFQASTLAERPYGMTLTFVTESIQEDFEKAIAAGAKQEVALAEKPWGQTVGYLRDPNGFLIEICTPIPNTTV